MFLDALEVLDKPEIQFIILLGTEFNCRARASAEFIDATGELEMEGW